MIKLLLKISQIFFLVGISFFSIYPTPIHFTQWFNVSKNLDISDFKGKIVVLHFWTKYDSDSLNSIHEVLQKKSKWKNEIIAIGVHSPISNDTYTMDGLKKLIIQLEIDYPVVHDFGNVYKEYYNIEKFPSFVVLNPDGKHIFTLSGVDKISQLEKKIDFIQKNYQRLDNTVFRFLDLERNKVPETILSFPSNLAMSDRGKELFIADTNNNRIIVVDPISGDVLDLIGNGERGNTDGKFQNAKLYHPTGLFYKNEKLYICDTNNHSIKVADINQRIIYTVVGNGKKGQPIHSTTSKKAMSLNLPNSVFEIGNHLFISNWGTNQIYELDMFHQESEKVYDFHKQTIHPIPLTGTYQSLIFLDNNIVHQFHIPQKKYQQILMDNSLTTFNSFELDNSLKKIDGMIFHNQTIFVSDPINHQIKTIDLQSAEVRILAGDGKSGFGEGGFLEASFHEPSGLVGHKEKVYVADKYNHTIRILDLKSSVVSNFQFKIDRSLVNYKKTSISDYNGETFFVDEVIHAHPSSTIIYLNFELPENYGWNLYAPFRFFKKSKNPKIMEFSDLNELEVMDPRFPMNLYFTAFNSGTTEIQVDSVLYFYYKSEKSLCLIKRIRLKALVKIDESGIVNPELKHKIQIEIQPNQTE